MELVCPVGTPVALRDAVDAGAHAVQCGFADETNARHAINLHFTRDELAAGIAYARAHGTRVIVAIESYMRAGAEALWMRAVDDAATLGADAILVSDIGLLAYAADRHPRQARHLALQLAATTAPHIDFLHEAFGVRRVVLPRGLLVQEVVQIAAETVCEIEVSSGPVLGGRAVDGAPSLDMLGHLAELQAAEIAALRIEDAPRGAAYVRSLVGRIEGERERAA